MDIAPILTGIRVIVAAAAALLVAPLALSPKEEVPVDQVSAYTSQASPVDVYGEICTVGVRLDSDGIKVYHDGVLTSYASWAYIVNTDEPCLIGRCGTETVSWDGGL